MRLITRPDLSGIACAVMITQEEHIEQVVSANPQDIEDGSIQVQPGDAIANLPHHPNAALWFDHHDKAEDEAEPTRNILGRRGAATSSARLINEYYNSPRLRRFESMLQAVDKLARADLSIDDVLHPQGWVLLSFILDPFMGLSNFQGFANGIIASIRSGTPIEQILDMDEVKGRVTRYMLDTDDFVAELRAVSRLEDGVLISDFRQHGVLAAGNRFLAFAIYPQSRVQIVWTIDSKRNRVRVRLGKSIFDKSCRVHLGKLAAAYGGGGLNGAAGCSFAPDEADAKVAEITEKLKQE